MKKPYFGDVFEQFGFTPHIMGKVNGEYSPVMLSSDKDEYFGHVSVHLQPENNTFSLRFSNMKFFGKCEIGEMSLKGRTPEELKDMLDYASKCSNVLTRFGLTTH